MFTLAKPIKGQHGRIPGRRWYQRQISPGPWRKTQSTQITKQNTGTTLTENEATTRCKWVEENHQQPHDPCAVGLCVKNSCGSNRGPTDLSTAGRYETTTETGGALPSPTVDENGGPKQQRSEGAEKSRPQYSRSQQRGLPSETGPHREAIPRNGSKAEQNQSKMDKGIRKVKLKAGQEIQSKPRCSSTLPENDRRGRSAEFEQLYKASQLSKALEKLNSHKNKRAGKNK